jgi:hypothetical protein
MRASASSCTRCGSGRKGGARWHTIDSHGALAFVEIQHCDGSPLLLVQLGSRGFIIETLAPRHCGSALGDSANQSRGLDRRRSVRPRAPLPRLPPPRGRGARHEQGEPATGDPHVLQSCGDRTRGRQAARPGLSRRGCSSIVAVVPSESVTAIRRVEMPGVVGVPEMRLVQGRERGRQPRRARLRARAVARSIGFGGAPGHQASWLQGPGG